MKSILQLAALPPVEATLSVNALRLGMCFLASCLTHAVALELLSASAPAPRNPTAHDFAIYATIHGTEVVSSAKKLPQSADSNQYSAASLSQPTITKSQAMSPIAPPATQDQYEGPVLLSAEEIDIKKLPGLPDGGYVDIELLVSPSGEVSKAYLVETNLPDDFFYGAAETFKSARFVPGKRAGIPFFSKYKIRVVFSSIMPSPANTLPENRGRDQLQNADSN